MKAGAVDPLRDALAYLAEASQRMEMRTRRREAGYVCFRRMTRASCRTRCGGGMRSARR